MKPLRILTVVLLVFFLLYTDTSQAQSVRKGRTERLIFREDFARPLDTTLWIMEMEPLPRSSVSVARNKLVLNTKGGVTLWLNKRLQGNIRIEYVRKVIVAGGANDRLSDFNQFWMAQDPQHPDLFTRHGKFEEYDNLRLYYVGLGGNTNSTTRFRKYEGNGERRLLKEYLDREHLLLPNKEYHVQIVVRDGTTSFYLDNVCYFSYPDADILRTGYFGLRSTYSHQEIDKLRIYQLD